MADVRQALNKESNDDERSSYLAGLLRSFGDVLGLFQQSAESFLLGDTDNDDVNIKIEALIDDRNAARTNKNWARADEVRDQLTAMGIILEDNAGKTTWRKA
jgi:cysteinyl-tRNA synthetase